MRTVLVITNKRFAPIGRVVDERHRQRHGGLLRHRRLYQSPDPLGGGSRAAGIVIDWDVLTALSDVVPLKPRLPNGSADVNQFQAAGGFGFVIRELLDAGLMHEDVLTTRTNGLREYTRAGAKRGGCADPAVAGYWCLRTIPWCGRILPFSATGGLKLLQGNLGRSVIGISQPCRMTGT